MVGHREVAVVVVASCFVLFFSSTCFHVERRETQGLVAEIRSECRWPALFTQ